MKWVVQIFLFFAVSIVGLKLMSSVVTYRDAEVWFKTSPGAKAEHLKGDVSYPTSGGIRVRTPDRQAITYPNAELISISFERKPYSWPEKLEFAGIILAVFAVWLLIAWPDIRKFRALFKGRHP
jgi:hypothetical protein